MVVTFSIYLKHTIPSRALESHSTITSSMWATKCLYHKYLHSLGNPIWSDDFYHQLFTHKALAILFWFLKTPYSLPLQGLCIYSFFCVKFSAPSFFAWLMISHHLNLQMHSFKEAGPDPRQDPPNFITLPNLFPSGPLDYMEISCLFAYLLIVCPCNLPSPSHLYGSLLRS